ncbi:MAG: Gfo/Idh/MocA family oxidoreductase [Oligosphaeraceae bacterium]|nr:Gfo/Idh/MocA family oxidoreductase [Oligosphaeraceae bacterium]
MQKVRIGILGFGNRGYSFVVPLLTEPFSAQAEIIAVCDPNELKLDFARGSLQACPQVHYCREISALLAQHPDVVFVTTPQFAHASCAIAALEAGCDVFLEKPMARSSAECRAIIAAEKRSGRRVFMGFNLRFNPVCAKTLELIAGGRIGRVQQMVCTDYYSGGFSYFRRWHRLRANSGGLTVEKGCHSIDQLNSYAGSIPVRVAAFGGLDRFKPDPEGSDYCSNCGKAGTCPYYMDMAKAEETTRITTGIDGIVVNGGEKLDLCVFNSDKDTNDNITIIIEYENSVRASLVECFTSSCQATTGRQFIINGWNGQIWTELKDRKIQVFDNAPGQPALSPEIPAIPAGSGRHGGADNQMLEYVISTIAHDRPNLDMLTRDGYYAVAVAEAAERSVEEGRMIEIEKL